MDEQVTDLPYIRVSIDPGTTTVVVCVQWSDSEEKHLLQFPSPSGEKEVEELDATVACSESKWFFGRHFQYLSGVSVFENIKLAIIGQQPYKDLLTAALRDAATEHGVTATPVTLFKEFFAHVLEVLEQQFLDLPGSEHSCHGRSFYEIPKHCWVTYPVRHNESLRIMLVEAALTAKVKRKNGDLKFDAVNGVSESLAAAYCVKFGGKHNVLAADMAETSKTMLIVDCGGGSTDAAAVYFDSEGPPKLACPTNGFGGGGQMIDKVALARLREQYPEVTQLADDDQWTSISHQFEGCKRVFDGISQVKMVVAGKTMIISSAEMTEFFRPLKESILRLIEDQYDAAAHSGYPPGVFVLCGGIARNRWFREMIFAEIQQEIRCVAEVAVGTVAKGALYYAQHPIAEVSVATEDIGLTYLEDQSPKGRPLGGDRVEEAIGWVIKKGEPAGRASHVELIKTVYRGRTGRPNPNHVITSDVYATTGDFPREKWTDRRIEWDCPVTYPITGLRSRLNRLGHVKADIPHNELFPSGTNHDRVEARFSFSIKPEGQLLRVDVSLKREGDTPLKLPRTFVPAAVWTPKSELDAENKRERSDEPRDSFPLPRKRRGRPRRSLTQPKKRIRAGSPMPNRHHISPRASLASQPPGIISPFRYAQHRQDSPAVREDQYIDASGKEDQDAIDLPARRHVVARGRERSLTL